MRMEIVPENNNVPEEDSQNKGPYIVYAPPTEMGLVRLDKAKKENSKGIPLASFENKEDCDTYSKIIDVSNSSSNKT